jgi:tetratricopeptide (TPR) repeat protein
LKSVPQRLVALGILLAGMTSACVYFNAMYDAGNAYDAGLDALQEGQATSARLQFDSVIAKTDRILRDHPGSKWADDAALLKTRSEINNKLWAAASESSVLALRLSGSGRDSATATGLGGIAALQLDQPARSDSMLSLALDGNISGDDRATFLFHRGLARLELGRASEAAADLQTASDQIDLTREARLELSRALRQIGEFERSADVTIDVLIASEFGSLSPAERAQVDSLSDLAPADLEPKIAALLASPGFQPSMRTMLQMLHGQALENLGDSEAAVAALDSAATAGMTNRWAQEASLRASMIRIRNADEPGEIQETIPALERAILSPAAVVRDTARQMARSALLFGEFTRAWESRGSSAAEAALRAAELAGTELESPAVARGLYLKYLELAPESLWVVKAIYGALAFSGYQPGDWVRDDGAATDRELLARIDAVPVDNPYRLALAGGVRDVWADSSYVLAEVDLERRITEIQMLFDTTVVRVQRDTIPVKVAPADDESDAPAEREFDF